jgi:hypothetical protein
VSVILVGASARLMDAASRCAEPCHGVVHASPVSLLLSGRACRCCPCCCTVDNVMLRDPPVMGVPLLAGLNLVPNAAQQQPCPGEQRSGSGCRRMYTFWGRGLTGPVGCGHTRGSSACAPALTTLPLLCGVCALLRLRRRVVPRPGAGRSSSSSVGRVSSKCSGDDPRQCHHAAAGG